MKKFLKKFWKFYWEDDSIISYIFFIIVTYIFLKYIALPAFLFVFGLSDVVSVMTTSMVHGSNTEKYFYDYYKDLNFSRNEINDFPFSKGLYEGDALIIKEYDDFEVGDVIVFYSEDLNRKIIHRVIDTNPLTTKGDNNRESYPFDKNVTNIIGRPIIKIPYIGYPRWLLYNITGL